MRGVSEVVGSPLGSSGVEELAKAVRRRVSAGDDLAVGRVVKVAGFSTLDAGDGRLLVVDRDGAVQGGPFSALAGAALAHAARTVFDSASTDPVAEVTLEIGDKEAVAAGLACGGRVDLVLQAAAAVPSELWDCLATRSPVALVTWLHGHDAVVVRSDGGVFGRPLLGPLLQGALEALRQGRSTSRIVEYERSKVLLEAWVPEPRLVVVGGGELVTAICAQAALLDWETRSTDGLADLNSLLEWSGASGALIVLSHDPDVDVPALASGLRTGIAYVGALGSRATQSRRTEQLTRLGVEPSQIARVHRPIGLDLGGRMAPEVALAIVAEVLACHYGRTAKPLRETTGPIHG
jgi:xanthine dehydrogenase accessory factor